MWAHNALCTHISIRLTCNESKKRTFNVVIPMKERLFAIIVLILASASLLSLFWNNSKPHSKALPQTEEVVYTPNFDSLRLANEFPNQVKALERYITAHKGKYSSAYGILIDMRLPSEHYRLFIVDLKKDSIVSMGLVAHGSGSETGNPDSLIFSNTPNSYMTSLGIYKIGSAYEGSFGRSYRLHGLESTNDKAFARAVVLHPYMCVPDTEQDYPICNSLGCPMVSENYFKTIDKYVVGEKLPVLLKIYY